jgi:hypothetical protein
VVVAASCFPAVWSAIPEVEAEGDEVGWIWKPN